MKKKEYDIVVLGAGPGGYNAAIRAVQKGFTAAVIEKENLGGVCLNWGCIPTKALLKSASVFSTVKNSKSYGINVSQVSFSIKEMVKRSRNIVNNLSLNVNSLLKKNKVDVIKGRGSFLNKNVLLVEDNSGSKLEVSAKYIILATGSRERQLPYIKIDNHLIWGYKDAMFQGYLPRKLTIIGGGAIGIEFASFYNALGCKVVIVECKSKILPFMDQEISEFMQNNLISKGIELIFSSEITEIKKREDSLSITLKKGNNSFCVDSDRLLVCVGVCPNSDNIGIENTNVCVEENGVIRTNNFLKTDENNIFAIGDLTYGPWLAHKAIAEAFICVDKIAGLNPDPICYNSIPHCIYSFPEVASVGLSELAAREKNDVIVGKFPFAFNGKSVSSGEMEGFVKTIFDKKTGEMMGAHMVGSNVTELIHSCVIAKKAQLTEIDILNSIFPHPTASESIQEAVLLSCKNTMNK